jgi:hypothetical protein
MLSITDWDELIAKGRHELRALFEILKIKENCRT